MAKKANWVDIMKEIVLRNHAVKPRSRVAILVDKSDSMTHEELDQAIAEIDNMKKATTETD